MARAARVRPACRVAFAGLVLVCFSGIAFGKDAEDGEDESAKAASAPNLYLDLRTNYATFPAGDPSPSLPHEPNSADRAALATHYHRHDNASTDALSPSLAVHRCVMADASPRCRP